MTRFLTVGILITLLFLIGCGGGGSSGKAVTNHYLIIQNRAFTPAIVYYGNDSVTIMPTESATMNLPHSLDNSYGYPQTLNVTGHLMKFDSLGMEYGFNVPVIADDYSHFYLNLDLPTNYVVLKMRNCTHDTLDSIVVNPNSSNSIANSLIIPPDSSLTYNLGYCRMNGTGSLKVHHRGEVPIDQISPIDLPMTVNQMVTVSVR